MTPQPCSCAYQVETVDGHQVVTLLTQCDAHLDAALVALADAMATALADLLMAGNHHNCGACAEVHVSAVRAAHNYDTFKKARG